MDKTRYAQMSLTDLQKVLDIELSRLAVCLLRSYEGGAFLCRLRIDTIQRVLTNKTSALENAKE